MGQERVFRTLLGLGLTDTDSKVYVFLAKRGLLRAFEMSKTLKLNKVQVYRSLQNLQSKGLVAATLEHPARFSAVPIEKVLDLFIKAKMEEAQEIQRDKAEILSIWDSISVRDGGDTAKFVVLEGRNLIYSRIRQMMQETKSQVSAILDVSSLVRAGQIGLFDKCSGDLKNKKEFRFLTEISRENLRAVKTFLKEMTKARSNIAVRNPDPGLRLFPRMVIRDFEEVMFFVTPNVTARHAAELDNTCLWTNSAALAQAFSTVFEDLWKNAVEIEQKMFEIEKRGGQSNTQLVLSAEAAERRYFETLRAARREVVILTSAEGVCDFYKQLPLLKEWNEKDISIRIMAPITNKNRAIAATLAKMCDVKQVSFNYPATTIVDGEHVLQWASSSQSSANDLPIENVTYTDNPEQVKRIELILAHLWGNAPPLSADLTVDFSAPTEGSPVAVKEYALKMKNASADALPKGHVICGVAYIHPPKNLDIPIIAIRVYKHTEESSFGAGNVMDVRLQLKRGNGYVLTPVALVNTNSKAMIPEKAFYAGSPAADNYHLVKPEQLQVSKQDNVIFGGWTFPIPLPPTQQSLPPAALLIEGYGEQRHSRIISSMPSGYRVLSEFDVLDAFVTFIDPHWKYAGAGSQGQVCFNETMTVIPPE